MPAGRRQARPGERARLPVQQTIAGIEEADACLIVGANPRWEAPMINARIRKRWLMGGLKVGVIGAGQTSDLRREIWAPGPETLEEIADGSHRLRRSAEGRRTADDDPRHGRAAPARRRGGAGRRRGEAGREPAGMIDGGWNGFNVLHTAAARVGGLDLGFVPGEGGRDLAGILEGAGQWRGRGGLPAGRRRDRHETGSATPS